MGLGSFLFQRCLMSIILHVGIIGVVIPFVEESLCGQVGFAVIEFQLNFVPENFSESCGDVVVAVEQCSVKSVHYVVIGAAGWDVHGGDV